MQDQIIVTGQRVAGPVTSFLDLLIIALAFAGIVYFLVSMVRPLWPFENRKIALLIGVPLWLLLGLVLTALAIDWRDL